MDGSSQLQEGGGGKGGGLDSREEGDEIQKQLEEKEEQLRKLMDMCMCDEMARKKREEEARATEKERKKRKLKELKMMLAKLVDEGRGLAEIVGEEERTPWVVLKMPVNPPPSPSLNGSDLLDFLLMNPRLQINKIYYISGD